MAHAAPRMPLPARVTPGASGCGASLSLVARARGADRRRGLHAAAVRVDADRPRSSRRREIFERRFHACGRAVLRRARTIGRALTTRAAAALRAERRHRLRAASWSCSCSSRSRAPMRSPSCSFPAARLLFALVLLGLCIPIQVPALPLYIALAELGLLNTYFAIMMPFFLSVFAIFLFRQFFKSYPGRDHPRGAARRHERVRDRLAHRRAERMAGHRRVLGVLDRRALERPVLAADRHLRHQSRDAAARHDVLRRRRDRLELRRADRRARRSLPRRWSSPS